MRAKNNYKPKKIAKKMKKQRWSGNNLKKQECEEMRM
jgi:hypothetical protein